LPDIVTRPSPHRDRQRSACEVGVPPRYGRCSPARRGASRDGHRRVNRTAYFRYAPWEGL